MGFELDGIIKGVLYNKDGTVDYVFDDVKLDEVIAPFENETDTEKNQSKALFLSSSENFEVSFESADISSDTILEISYVDLKEMLDDFQSDGLNADGCGCALHLDEDEEIQYAIKNGTIRIRENKK